MINFIKHKTIMLNFVIPNTRDELIGRKYDQFYVEEVLSSKLIPVRLQEAKADIYRNGGIQIASHFDVFFSLIIKFYELNDQLKQMTWNVLIKGCESFSNSLTNVLNEEVNENGTMDSENRQRYLTSLKMNIYLLVQLSDLNQSQYRQNAISNAITTPKKKGSKAKVASSDTGLKWDVECGRVTQLLMSIVDLDIHRLWELQQVEGEFVGLISNLGYKILEDSVMIKNKTVKTSTFHLLGCIIKKYNQSLSTSLKLVQMLQNFDHVAQLSAEAVEIWTNTYKCKSLVNEILRELSQVAEKEFVRDNTSTKTVSVFIQELSALLPAQVLSNISLLQFRMEEESYLLRNAVLVTLGEITKQCLKGDGLTKREKKDRNQFLDILYDHGNRDCHAFVRSKSLQIFQMLVKDQALPTARFIDLVDLCICHMLDKSNLVRKMSIQLLETLLKWNPFSDSLSIKNMQEELEEAKLKLDLLQQQKDTNQPNMEEKVQENKAEKEQQVEEEEGTIEETLEKVGGSLDKSESSEKEEGDDEEREEKDSNNDSPEKKEVVNYINFLTDSIRFVEKFQECVPVLCQLLNSQVQTDVLEAINFFTAAWKFQLNFAMDGISGMLEQIWNEEKKVREAVISAYKELYFKTTCDANYQQANEIANNMVVLCANSSNTKLLAVGTLLPEMQKAKSFPPSLNQILWDRLVSPPTAFTMERGISEHKQQIVITQIIGMFAKENSSIIKSKIDTLVEIGFKFTDNDYELAYQTCITLSHLKGQKLEAGKYETPFKLNDSHNAITSIIKLILEGFAQESYSWSRFALQGVSLIFQLAEHPIIVAKQLFLDIRKALLEHMKRNDIDVALKNEMLSRFFNMAGQNALKLLVYIEGDVQAEIKQKRKVEEEEESEKKGKKETEKSLNKSSSNLEEDMGVGGATADDGDQEFIRKVLESEVVASDTLLGSLSEMIVRTCTLNVDGKHVSAVTAQKSAALALSKYMLVSSDFCERHLRLFFTILESSEHEGIRANLVIAAGDLCVRFPNLLDSWTSHIYARLNDSSVMVRIFAVKVLTNLILNDMIKVKGHVSEMARCLVDENERISILVRKFFKDLAKKGNSVYNVMPDIISRLSDVEVGIKDNVDFKAIMRFLFEFIQKDKQNESLVEKLCHRFKLTRDRQQWRDLAYCMSLLTFHEKAFKRLNDCFGFYAPSLRDENVFFSFQAIVVKVKKIPKPDVKPQVEEYERKLIDAHTQGASEDKCEAKAVFAIQGISQRSQALPQTPSRRVPPRSTRKQRRKRSSSSDDEDAMTSSPPPPSAQPSRRSTRRHQKVVNFSDSESEDDDVTKENVPVSNELLEDSQELVENECTPIRRRRTPQRTPSRSVLRA